MPEKETDQPPDGGYGWVIVVSIIIINVSLLALVSNFGIIFKNEFDQMDISAAKISFLLHLHNSIFCIFGLLLTPLLKTYSYRIISLAGASIMCLGVFLSSFFETYGGLIFSVSICIGVGQGIIMPATYLATNSYFKEKLTIATSVSVTGASLSPIILPHVCQKLLKIIGRKYTVLFLFGLSLLSIPCCLLLKPIPKSKPKVEVREEEELVEHKSIYAETTILKPEETCMEKLYNMFDLDLLKNKTYVLIVIVLGVSYVSELNTILTMQFIIPELCKSTAVATAVSVIFIFDIVGRLVIPLLFHFSKIKPKISYSFALILSSVGRIVMGLYKLENNVVLFCCCLIGLSKGSRAVFQSVIIPNIVPLEKLPAANGLNFLFTGILSLIIGPIIGEIHDKTNSYAPSLYVVSTLSILCVTIWIIEHIFRKCSQPPTEETIEVK